MKMKRRGISAARNIVDACLGSVGSQMAPPIRILRVRLGDWTARAAQEHRLQVLRP